VTVWYACYMYTCTNCTSSWLFTRITTLNCLVSETLAIYKFCRLIFLLFYDFQTTTFRENFLIPTAGDVITRIPFPFTLLLETQTVEESRNIFTLFLHCLKEQNWSLKRWHSRTWSCGWRHSISQRYWYRLSPETYKLLRICLCLSLAILKLDKKDRQLIQLFAVFVTKRGAVNTTNKVLLTVFTLLFIFLIILTLQNLSLFVSLYFLTELFLFNILLHYSPSL